jgi:hypothetical protein
MPEGRRNFGSTTIAKRLSARSATAFSRLSR